MTAYRALRVCAAAVSLAVCLAHSTGAAEESFLFVKSAPSGARISVDGVPTPHKTPRVMRGIPPGRHLIVLELTGYDSARTEVTVGAGTIETVDLALNEANASGSLTVDSTPQGATVWLDTTERGLTPVTIEDLDVGTHQLVVSLEGHEDTAKEIEIRAGAKESVELQLEATPEAEKASRSDSGGAADAAAEDETPEKHEVNCPYCKGSGRITSIGCEDCRSTGQQARRACGTCSGKGRVGYHCQVCAGNGVLASGTDCRACEGKGTPPCTACGAKGKILRYNPEAAKGETKECGSCNGSGYDAQTTCRICAGTGNATTGTAGTRRRFTRITVECKACGGDGKGPPICSLCNGMGYRGSNKLRVHCLKCCGVGQQFIPCKMCRGRGFVKKR